MAFRKPMRLEKWIAFDGAVGADVLTEVVDPHDAGDGDPDAGKVFEYGREDAGAESADGFSDDAAEAEAAPLLMRGIGLRSNTYTEQYDLNGHDGKETSVTLPNTIASDGVNPSLPFHDIARIEWSGAAISSQSIFMEVIAPNYGEHGRLTFLRKGDTETLNYFVGAGVLSVGDVIAYVDIDQPGETQILYLGNVQLVGGNYVIGKINELGKAYATNYSLRFSQDILFSFSNQQLLTILLDSILYIPNNGAGVHSDGAKLNLFYIGDGVHAVSPPGALEESDSSYYTDDLFKGETQYKPPENTGDPGGDGGDGGDSGDDGGNENLDPEPGNPVVVRPPVIEDPVEPVPESESENNTVSDVPSVWPDPVVPPVSGSNSGPGGANGSDAGFDADSDVGSDAGLNADAADAVRDGMTGLEIVEAGSGASAGFDGADSAAGGDSVAGAAGQHAFAYSYNDEDEYDELSVARNTLPGEAGALTIMEQAAAAGNAEMESASVALALELVRELDVWREAVREDRQALAVALANLQDEYQARSQEEWGEVRESLRRLFVNGSGEMRAVNRILGEMDRQLREFGESPPGRRDGMMLATLGDLVDSAARRSGETGALAKAMEAVARTLREARLAHDAGPDAAGVEAVFARTHDGAVAEWELVSSRRDSMGRVLAARQMLERVE